MSYTDPEERAEVINGLRALADFLDGNIEVPVPHWTEMLAFPSVSTDQDMRAEVDRVAALIGSAADDRTAIHGHYSVSRKFGPVEYRMVAILARARASHDALMSYSGRVIPDSSDEVR